MISFVSALVVLLVGCFVWGRAEDRAFGTDDRQTPAIQSPDGVACRLHVGVSLTYILMAKEGLRLFGTVSYPIGIIFSAVLFCLYALLLWRRGRKNM